MAPMRPSRKSSRVASPAVRAVSATSSPSLKPQTLHTGSNLAQSSLDGWLEPPVQIASSFEQAGLERTSLFDNMQPLGALPNPAKLKYKSARVPDKRHPFRLWDNNAVSTPEFTPPVEVKEAVADDPELAPSTRAASVEKDEVEQENAVYLTPKDAVIDEVSIETPIPIDPQIASLHEPSPMSPTHPPALSADSVATTESASTQDLSTIYTSSSQPPQSMDKLSIMLGLNRPSKEQRVRNDAVYEAVRLAVQASKDVLGAAILRLYQESKEDTALADIFDAIWLQHATYDQQQEWGVRLKTARAAVKAELAAKALSPGPVKQVAPDTPTTPLLKTQEPRPPMGNFHTTPSRPTFVAQTPSSSQHAMTRTSLQSPVRLIDAKLSVARSSQPSSKHSSRKSSNATAPVVLESSDQPMKSKEVEDPVVSGAMEPSVIRRSSRRLSARGQIEAEQPMEDTAAVVASRTRSARPSGLSAAPTPKPLTPKPSPKPAPVTPQTARETRSARRRQSSSDLSSVNEEIVNEGLPVSLGVATKRTALEAALDDDTEETSRRKRRFNSELANRQMEFESIATKSHERPLPSEPPKQRLTLKFNEGRSTRAQKRQREEEIVQESDAMLSPEREGLSAGAARNARALGPPERPVKKPRTGARTKISPIKDRSTAAGVSRIFGNGPDPDSRQATPSRVNNEEMDSSDENQDFCGACGEAGELICCDGCENAFHFKCCDPPIKPGAAVLDQPYYCHVCQRAHSEEVPGIFGPLHEKLRSTNTTAFQLPKSIRGYFEGVSTKSNGEYADNSRPQVPYKPRHEGWEDTAEGIRTREKEREMRCKSCGGSNLGGRAILQCDFCPGQWHLDCLNPPLVNPPVVHNSSKTRDAFRCPLHIENDLKLIGNSQAPWTDEEDGAPYRTHRLRKPRHPHVITPHIQRGNRNNGFIEVELEDEPIEQEDGVVYKLPEATIKLDFIQKAKAERAERLARMAAQNASSTSNPVVQDMVKEEVSRRVAAQVQVEAGKLRDLMTTAQRGFARLSAEEQNTAISLLDLGQQPSQNVNTNPVDLTALTRASSTLDPVKDTDAVGYITNEDLRDPSVLYKLREIVNTAITRVEAEGGWHHEKNRQEATQSGGAVQVDTALPQAFVASNAHTPNGIEQSSQDSLSVSAKEKEKGRATSLPAPSSAKATPQKDDMAVRAPATSSSMGGKRADHLDLEANSSRIFRASNGLVVGEDPTPSLPSSKA